MDRTKQARTYFLLIFTTVVWGFQPTCIKWLVAVWSPVTVTSVRHLIISLVLLAVAWRQSGSAIWPRGLKCWLGVIGMGFTGITLNNVLQFTGLEETTVTNCTLIAATSPALTAAFAAVFIRERLSLLSWFGIVVSFGGVLAVVSHGSWEVVRQIDFNRGDLFCFASQMAWILYSFIGLRVMKRLTAAAATGWAGLTGAGMTWGYGLAAGDFQVTALALQPMLSFLYTIVLGGILAMLFWNIGVREAGPSLSSIFLNIMPVVGMMAGYFCFDDEIGAVQLGGALAICSGVYLTTHSEQAVHMVHHVFR